MKGRIYAIELSREGRLDVNWIGEIGKLRGMARAVEEMSKRLRGAGSLEELDDILKSYGPGYRKHFLSHVCLYLDKIILGNPRSS